MKSKIWSLSDVKKLLPDIIRITGYAFEESQAILKDLDENILPENVQELKEAELQVIISEWAIKISKLGADIKGLWLVDFDNGNGYYCWKYGEEDIIFEHTYESGFAGRKPISEE